MLMKTPLKSAVPAVMGIALLFCLLFVTVFDPVGWSLRWRNDETPQLQGKDEDGANVSLTVSEMKPQDPFSLPLVKGLKPGEGRDNPAVPRSSAAVHPFGEFRRRTPVLSENWDGVIPGCRILVFESLFLCWHKPLFPSIAQRARILDILKNGVELEKKHQSLMFTVLNTFDEYQLNTLYTAGEPEMIKSISVTTLHRQTSELIDLLKHNRKKPSVKSVSARSTGDQQVLMNLPALVTGLDALCRKPRSLSPDERRRLLKELEPLKHLLKERIDMVEDGELFTARQNIYLQEALRDPAMIERTAGSFVSSADMEPVLGVDATMYIVCRSLLKKDLPLEADSH